MKRLIGLILLITLTSCVQNTILLQYPGNWENNLIEFENYSLDISNNQSWFVLKTNLQRQSVNLVIPNKSLEMSEISQKDKQDKFLLLQPKNKQQLFSDEIALNAFKIRKELDYMGMEEYREAYIKEEINYLIFTGLIRDGSTYYDIESTDDMNKYIGIKFSNASNYYKEIVVFTRMEKIGNERMLICAKLFANSNIESMLIEFNELLNTLKLNNE
jgi:hypothetical protein